jgi:heat shock protein HslJ
MRISRSFPLVSLLAIALVLPGCADGAGAGEGGQIRGVTWIMDRASVALLEPDAPAQARATIRFDDGGELGGISFCNLYGGTYRVDGGEFAIEVGAMTEMACDEPVMSMESVFVAFLGAVRSFRVEGDGLTLVSDDLELTFDAEQSEPLVGTTWRIDGLVEGEVATSTIAGTGAFVVLDEDGGLSGETGCSGMIGTYEVDGERLSFGPIETTERACADPAMNEQEAAILRALSVTASYAIQGEALSLSDGDGALVLTLVVD